MERSLQNTVGVAAALVFLFAASGAEAQSSSARYRFTTLLDSQDGLVPTRCPAINGLGTVAVLVEDTLLGFDKLITKRDARDEPVVVAHTERVANYPTFCDNGFTQITSNASINDLGEVAFQGISAGCRRLRPAPHRSSATRRGRASSSAGADR